MGDLSLTCSASRLFQWLSSRYLHRHPRVQAGPLRRGDAPGTWPQEGEGVGGRQYRKENEENGVPYRPGAGRGTKNGRGLRAEGREARAAGAAGYGLSEATRTHFIRDSRVSSFHTTNSSAGGARSPASRPARFGPARSPKRLKGARRPACQPGRPLPGTSELIRTAWLIQFAPSEGGRAPARARDRALHSGGNCELLALVNTKVARGESRVTCSRATHRPPPSPFPRPPSLARRPPASRETPRGHNERGEGARGGP